MPYESADAASAAPASFHRLVAAAGLSFAVCYAAVLVSLVTLWSTYPLYSHGFAVPLIAGWLCWTKSRNAPAIPRHPDYLLGVPLVLAGIAMLLVGRVGSVQTIAQTSLIVALAGFVLVFFGRETLTFYRFPFAYLLFMVPIWDVALNHLQDPSRLISARLGTAFLHLANVPVIRHESILMLPSVTLSVMRQCSGVNQLVAILAMVVPASYVFLDGNRRRLVLIVFSVVIGYVSNGFRIALVGWLAIKGLRTGDLAESYTHVMEGLVVSAAGYAVIMVVLTWLARFNRASDHHPVALPPQSVQPRMRRPFIDAAVIGAMTLAGVLPLLVRSKSVEPVRDLRLLPTTVGDWRAAAIDAIPPRSSGVSEDLVGAYPTPAGVRTFVGVDDEVSRVYENSSAVPLRLYVGYYRQQHEGRELTADAGQVLAAASTPVVLTSASKNVTAREVVRTEAGRQRGILYWYDLNGRIVSDTYLTKAYTVWNGLTRWSTNGAVIMITWDTRSVGTVDGQAQAHAFARELLPVLRTYLDSSADRVAQQASRGSE